MAPAQAAPDVTINLVDINDFHGRIDANTVKWAGTIEQLRAADRAARRQHAAARLAATTSARPCSRRRRRTTSRRSTCSTRSALDASTVGNHEFDQGFADLENRVIDRNGYRPTPPFDYLGANVYFEGTTTPVLPAYTIFTSTASRSASSAP